MDPATIQHVKPAALAALRKDVWWTLSISFSRKVDMFVKQLLHCTGLSAQRVQLKLGWTPQKSHASWCCHMISIYFSCRLYQLWGFSNILEYVSSCLPWVFSAAKPSKTAGLVIEEGSWAWDKARSACWSFNSSIVQANGRGYLICRWISVFSETHSRKTLRPNFHQIACWPVRDPAYIHIQSFKLL